jgi:hypothetical protein
MSGISKRVSLNRLRKLREVMASAKKVRGGYVIDLGEGRVLFDMEVWSYGLKREKHGCGTACCLAGTAGMIPSFRRAGLKTDSPEPGDTGGIVHGEALTPLGAFARFFGLDDITANDLTFPSSYTRYPDIYERWKANDKSVGDTITPRDVVRALDEVIAEVEARPS